MNRASIEPPPNVSTFKSNTLPRLHIVQSTLGNFLHGSTTPEWLRDGVRCVLHAVKGRSEPMHQLNESIHTNIRLINPHFQIDSTLTLDNDREEEDEAYKVLHVHPVAPHAVVGALIPIIPRRHPGRRRGTEVVDDDGELSHGKQSEGGK